MEWKFSSRRIPIDMQIFSFLTIDVNVDERRMIGRALRNQIFIKFCKHASPIMLKPSLVSMPYPPPFFSLSCLSLWPLDTALKGTALFKNESALPLEGTRLQGDAKCTYHARSPREM